MKRWKRNILLLLLAMTTLLLAGCDGNIGVGMSVGVPVGNNGYMHVSSGRWF